MSTESLVFNGINGATGSYLTEETSPHEIVRVVLGEKIGKSHLTDLKKRKDNEHDYLPEAGINKKDLAQTGWGVIFAYDESQEVKEALKELLDYRKEQVGDLYREYKYNYDPSESYFESKTDFLKRHKVSAGPANPKKMPYYLLIVGDPERIPYIFQYELDVQYAVGRIHFETPEEYMQYARNVVVAEKAERFLPPEALFFGVRNQDDIATNLSAKYLIKGLADIMKEDQPNWKVNTLVAEQTKKSELEQVINGKKPPAFLFTASHGMGFPNGHPEQLPCQGALLCQDWPGPKEWRKAIPRDFYFSADDVSENAQLAGLIAFHFACYGGGTPRSDEFALRAYDEQRDIAPHAFVARLPQKLLQRGALAVVGHVERAWGYSFQWEDAGAQLSTFKSTLKELMQEYPIGAAFEYFNGRYAELSTVLTTLLGKIKFDNEEVDDLELSGIWTANNDARNYSIIGDPAVRLPVGKDKTSEKPRPTITPIKIRTEPTLGPASEPESPAGTSKLLRSEPSPESAITAESPEAAVDFGVFDSLKQTRASLTNALQQFSEKLSKTLADVTSLEVTTYVSDDMAGVEYDHKSGQFTGTARPRAWTRINLDGDIKNCVPKDKGEIDKDLWSIHLDMVKQAQSNRAEFVKTLFSLLDTLKGL